MQRFEGKTVVVTGGGGGIGGATCRRFARGRRPRRGVRPEPRGGREGGGGHPGRGRPGAGVPLRHHRPRQRRCRRGGHRGAAGPDRRAGQQRRLGRVQALHQDRAGAVGQADRDQPDRRAAHAPRRAARHGGAQAGRIVNIASDAARVGSSGEAVYAACKGGLVAFSKTIAREHARHGITVNVVCPGPTDTALFAGVQGRRRQPREADGGVHALHPARAASASPTTCRAPSRSSPATTPASSPARC